jgi:hypothetical protein
VIEKESSDGVYIYVSACSALQRMIKPCSSLVDALQYYQNLVVSCNSFAQIGIASLDNWTCLKQTVHSRWPTISEVLRSSVSMYAIVKVRSGWCDSEHRGCP